MQADKSCAKLDNISEDFRNYKGNKFVWGLFKLKQFRIVLGKGIDAIKTVMDIEAGIPLTHHSMKPVNSLGM
jgi:hypothetical protein